MEFDATFIEGVAATVAGIIVFCGSVFLLLTFVMGAKLAYFVTASVTLGFLLIMGLIWGWTNPIAPLGPVGELPEWSGVAAAEEGGGLEGPSGSEYPDQPWREANDDDEAEVTKSTELQNSAVEFAVTEAEEGNLPETVTENYLADAETVRLLEQDGTEYGAVTLEAPEGDEGPPVVTLMEYDPGNPQRPAKMITAGTFLLLVGHLFLLSRSEKQARRKREEAKTDE